MPIAYICDKCSAPAVEKLTIYRSKLPSNARTGNSYDVMLCKEHLAETLAVLGVVRPVAPKATPS